MLFHVLISVVELLCVSLSVRSRNSVAFCVTFGCGLCLVFKTCSCVPCSVLVVHSFCHVCYLSYIKLV